MRKALLPPVLYVYLILTMIGVLPDVSVADPRAHVIKIIPTNQAEHNATVFVSNFFKVMTNISTQMQNKGYGTAVMGSGPDANYGLGQCYGDLSLLDCVLCYGSARPVVAGYFPSNGARVFLDGCFLRFANYSFFQEYTGPQDTIVCDNTTKKDSLFQESARRAVIQVVSNAPHNKGYGRTQLQVAGRANESAYVLANCWETLSVNYCKACLEKASESITRCFPWSDGRALNTGCFMRYSDSDFLNPIPGSGSSKGTRVIIAVAALSSAILLVAGTLIGLYILKNRRIQKKRRGSYDEEKLVKILKDTNLYFKYSVLKKATGSFDESNKLGQGGFGTVYKGVLPDGRIIAVKRLFFNNNHRAADFYNEVNIISSLEHKNLVRLLGCSCSGPESLLVYEFLPNKSLDQFIFDPDKDKTPNWKQRFEIIIGIAEGLVYLHENPKVRIIHRDIKASNVLLDSRLRAKIADFGLARSFQEDKSHISTSIAGTLGYMAPEYLVRGQLTEKADVYSFGILLFEIVTGKQNSRSKSIEYSDSLVTIAWKHFLHGTVKDLLDPNLMLYNYHNSYVKNELQRMVQVGLLCTQEIPSLRPSMSTALRMLVNEDERLPIPTSPPFIDWNTMEISETLENPEYPSNTLMTTPSPWSRTALSTLDNIHGLSSLIVARTNLELRLENCT